MAAVASVVGLLLMLVTGGAAMLVTLGGLMRMLAEESALRSRYPEYLPYARKTKRMLPYVF